MWALAFHPARERRAARQQDQQRAAAAALAQHTAMAQVPIAAQNASRTLAAGFPLSPPAVREAPVHRLQSLAESQSEAAERVVTRPS
jgi:hypothetical protein